MAAFHDILACPCGVYSRAAFIQIITVNEAVEPEIY